MRVSPSKLCARSGLVRGSYALAVLFRDFPDTLFAVKRESPLIVGWGEGGKLYCVGYPGAAEIYPPVQRAGRGGTWAVVNADGIRFYNEFAEPVEREVLTANWDQELLKRAATRTSC